MKIWTEVCGRDLSELLYPLATITCNRVAHSRHNVYMHEVSISSPHSCSKSLKELVRVHQEASYLFINVSQHLSKQHLPPAVAD